MIWLNELSTVVMFVAFLAIVFWAWSSKRRASFDEAARLPLDEGDEDGSDRRADRRATGKHGADA